MRWSDGGMEREREMEMERWMEREMEIDGERGREMDGEREGESALALISYVPEISCLLSVLELLEIPGQLGVCSWLCTLNQNILSIFN